MEFRADDEDCAVRTAIDIQTSDFDVGKEMAWLRADSSDMGAVVAFVGLVRDFSERPDVQGLYLEHYPGMTERSLADIASEAAERWPLQALRIIHRVGELTPGEQIVLVLAGSAHRGDAFAACEFVMDYLKVRAPFWKKERTSAGDQWVESRDGDRLRAEKWRQATD